MRDDSALAKFFYPYDTLLNRPSVRDKLIVLVTIWLPAMRQRMDVTRYRVDLLALAQSAGHRPQIIVRMANI